MRHIYEYFLNSWKIKNKKCLNKNLNDQLEKNCEDQYKMKLDILAKNKILVFIQNKLNFGFDFSDLYFIIDTQGNITYKCGATMGFGTHYKLTKLNKNFVLQTKITSSPRTYYIINVKTGQKSEYQYSTEFISSTNYVVINNNTLEHIISKERKQLTNPNLQFYNKYYDGCKYRFSSDGQ